MMKNEHNSKCSQCHYRKFNAKVFDMHFDYRDCPLDECIMNDVPDINVGKKKNISSKRSE